MLLMALIDNIHHDFAVDCGDKKIETKADTSDGSSLPTQSASEYNQPAKTTENTLLQKETIDAFSLQVYDILGKNSISQKLVEVARLHI